MGNFTVKKVMKFAVVTEEMGAEYYASLAKKFSENKELADIFSRLADDERSHAAQFRGLAEEVPEDKIIAEDDGGVQMRAAVASQFFDRKELQQTDRIESKQDALTKALAFERSTLFYYQSLEDVLGKTPQIEALIQAEKSHMNNLMKVVLADAKFRGLSDVWS
jgi:rubrerythrin